MSHPRALRRGTALRALLGVFVLTAAVLGLARPALGHYPVVKGEVVCAVDGQQVVHWEVENFTEGADRTMVFDEVTITPAGSNLTGTIVVGQTVRPNHLDDAEPARGTSVFPGDATHEVTLTVTVSWRRPDGSVSTKEPETRSHTVKLPGDCKDTTTTTTTVPESTTTTTTTTTTVPDSTTTTTVADSTTTTTTTVPDSTTTTTTTTVPDSTTTTTTTTVPDSTTTTTTAATTTTTAAATTTTTAAATQVLGTVQERQGGGQAGQIAAQADSRQVAGQQAQRQRLPRTGSPTLAMSALALALVAFGSVLTRTAHRPAPAHRQRR